MIGLLLVPRVSAGFSVVCILPSVLNVAHAFTGDVGWMYSLIIF
ncbi:MAG: hypothetical protein WCL18_01375 [bacterium]